MTRAPQDRHIAAARARLVDLQSLAQRTEATERAILAAARTMLEAAEGEAAKLRPRAMADDAVRERYLKAMEEAGRCRDIIARAEERLGE